MRCKAVIFDLDGTLIDTEKLYRKYWPEALLHFGYELSDERALMLRSLGRPFAPEQFRKWFGEDFDYPAVRAYRGKLIEAHIAREGVAAKPHAKEALCKLREKGYIVAIATATDPERTERYLKLAGLSGLIPTVISATMVSQGKPAPDIYLRAAARLGLDPADCVVCEDSRAGVLSAKAAGMFCVALMQNSDFPYQEDLSEADLILENLGQFPIPTEGDN